MYFLPRSDNEVYEKGDFVTVIEISMHIIECISEHNSSY